MIAGESFILSYLLPLSLTPLPSCDDHPPTTCDNIRLDYAIQKHNFGPLWEEEQDYVYPMTFFHTAPTSQSGTTKSVGFTNQDRDALISIYGGAPISTTQIAVNHRAYFVAPSTGVYTIIIEGSDDLTHLWLGPTAFNGNYNEKNADFTIDVSSAEGTHTVSLNEGQWYPFRVIMVNVLAETLFGFKILGPDMEELLSDKVREMPYFRSHSCDGVYPRFQAWGQETAS